MKRYSTNFVQFPPREATSVPWEQVHVNLISPWNMKVRGHKKPVQFIALMCIDPALNLLEVGTVKEKTWSEQVTKTFKRLWLSLILNQEHAFMIVDQNLLHTNSKPC
jgi:hypothetical protein